jgi:ankyrin repeat protein
VTALLDAGADINFKSAILQTPLHYAAHTGKCDIVELLIQRGADINAAAVAVIINLLCLYAYICIPLNRSF